jgi:hypothetical protein
MYGTGVARSILICLLNGPELAWTEQARQRLFQHDRSVTIEKKRIY